jgi:two-component system chemotaxis sensor kinase CheA
MDEVLRQVVQIFAEEVKEQAQRIGAALMAMERDAQAIPLQIEELYRQAHSLKGSSSSLAVTELEQLAHWLEEALTPVRRAGAALRPELVDAALRAMDHAQLRAEGLLADTNRGLDEVKASTEELRAFTVGAPATVAPAVQPIDPVPSAPAAPVEEADTLRVSSARLLGLERRLDEMRAVRGRLEHRADSAGSLIDELEELWRATRARAASPLAAALSPDRVYQTLRRIGALRRDLVDDAELAQSSAADLDDNLRALRMVPFKLLAQPLQRALRDACRRTDKEARLEIAGGDSEVDRRLLEELKNPLLHLVRNAVDHGIEVPDVREAVGKPACATVTVSVEQRGREVVIDVRDDGRGIDTQAVRAKAIERGLLDEERAAELEDPDLHELLFQSGFSTASTVTELSGRGVGLDVVRDAVLRLHGRIELTSEPGRGARFHLAVPLTVAASETMLVEEGGRPFALPQSSLERIVRARLSELRPTGGRVYFHLDDHPVPVVRLARVVGLTERHDGSGWVMLAVLRAGAHRAALVCERLLGSRDLVLRPVPPELSTMKLLNAVAILPDGRPILVLSPSALVDAATLDRVEPAARRSTPGGTILIADDSITTRALLRNALEASGYRVRVASDGDEALRLALAEPIDLVVSDVRMPRVDGYELTARLKADPRTERTPVVLFSSLDSEEDKRRGAVSGASAYLTKGAYERGQLLDVVNGLIRGS